jgi:hypothetical protein
MNNSRGTGGSSLKAAGHGIMQSSGTGAFKSGPSNSQYGGGRDLAGSSKGLNYGGNSTTAGGATYITEVPMDMGPTREQIL